MPQPVRRWAALVCAAATASSVATSYAQEPRAHDASALRAPASHTSVDGMAGGASGRVRVAGEGGGSLQMSSFKGHRMSIRLDASTEVGAPVDVDGGFHVVHRREDGSLVADFEGRADCLMAGGDVAVVTGVITRADAPGFEGQDLVGVRVGITVDDDGRHDRLGWSWLVMGFNPVSGCTSTAPFFPVGRGGFRVRSPGA